MKLEKVIDFAGIPTTVTIERLNLSYGTFTYEPIRSTLKYAKVVQLQKVPKDTSSVEMVTREGKTFLTYNGLYKVSLKRGASGCVPVVCLQGDVLQSLDRTNPEKVPTMLKADKAEAKVMARWFEAVVADLDAQFSFVE